ncbi:hypothetical protein B0H13DRAFT_2319802 [Mycena leptocephala]|nr:hypothetical protein B0H13DRAFT_2319802 [Mycena leptocephala]
MFVHTYHTLLLGFYLAWPSLQSRTALASLPAEFGSSLLSETPSGLHRLILVVNRWRSRSVADEGLDVDDAADIHDLVLKYGPKVWYLNGLQREAECIHYYRTDRHLALPIDE